MTDIKNTSLQEKSILKVHPNSHKKDGEEESSLLPSIKKETISIVKGIGRKTAEKLNRIGIHTVMDLAQESPESVAQTPGIGLAIAQKYVRSAKEHMKIKKLNNFSENHRTQTKSVPIQTSQQLSKSDESEYTINDYYRFLTDEETIQTEKEYIHDPNVENENELVSPDDIIKYDLEDYQEPSEEDDNRSLNSFELLDQELCSETPSQAVIPPEVSRQLHLASQEKEELPLEIIPRAQIQERIKQLTKILHLFEFSLIEHLSKLRTIFTGIDLLAIKHVRVQKFVDLIYLIPIKICALTGSLLVSNEDINYTPSNTVIKSCSPKEDLPHSYLKALLRSQMALYSDMHNEGALLQYLSKYLGVTITLEKSFTRKTLFFRSGPLLHNILIEPILVSFKRVGFTEKIVPFAYHFSTNTHIIELSQFSDLLQYLDQKYFLLETYKEGKNALELNCEASNRFVKDMRKYSTPFILYGLLILIILLSQAFSVLPLIINLGYGVVCMYIIVMGYLYLRLSKQKAGIHQDFATPYYQKKLSLPESTLVLINEELSPQFMDQFTFECIKENSDYNFIHKREQENAERYLSEYMKQKKVNESTIFESEIQQDFKKFEDSPHSLSSKNQTNSVRNSNIIDKYGSFLEE
ncbi:MAG: helix-hairpin-helix domain-containing protein [Candidatus Odinarchaeota archaeon]